MSDLSLFVTSRRFRLLWMIPAGLLAAVLLGVAVSRFGAVLFALLAAPLSGWLLYLWPDMGVYIITLTLPIEDLIPGVGAATGTRLLGMGVFGVWAVRKIIRRESWMPLLKSPMVLAALLLAAWAFMSLLWAETRGVAIIGLLSLIQLVFLALITIDVIKTWDKIDWIIRLLIIGGLIASISTLHQYFILGVKRAGDGVSGGINFTASSLVTLLPFAFYLFRSNSPGFWKFLGLVYLPLGITAVIVTFSRTSYIFMGLILFVQVLLMLRTRSGPLWVIVIGGLSMGALVYAPQEAVSERVQTISPLIQGFLAPDANNAVQADVRAYHWKVGMEMLSDSPILGVGYSNFGLRFLTYQFDVQGTPEIFHNPRSPHSSYVGILTELGLVGIGLFLVMMGLAARNLVKSAQWLSRAEDLQYRYMVEAFLSALLLQVLYGWALNTHMNKNFWLILGISVVLYTLSMRRARQQQKEGGSHVY